MQKIDVAIIGSGFSGLGMAIKLKAAGMHDFVVMERAGAIGGTWRDNHYPGCACDVQSHVYSFSFAPNPRWSRMFAPQAEIHAYLHACAARFGIEPHLRLNCELVHAAYDEAIQRWNLRFGDGSTLSARVLISGMGGLSRASLPDIPGLDGFTGRMFHSQQWDHRYALEGKRVAVIGTGASAIQFVPRIAARVERLTLFQRTPPWIMPKPDRALRAWEHWLFAHVPVAQRLARSALYWQLESRALGFSIHPALMKSVQKLALRHLRKQVRDPALREVLTPDYTIGCKRVLLSNDYYPALTRPNVKIVSASIARIEGDAVVTEDGRRHSVDCLILGTGFHVTDPVPRGLIHGRGGTDIVDAWHDGAHAYLGSTLPGFPNFFMIVGPNTGLGHNSMVYMIEAQVDYVVRALQTMRRRQAHAIEVRAPVEQAYNARVQAKLARAIWSIGGCRSWYLDPKTGKNTTLWPGFAWRFRQATSQFRLADYHAYAAADVAATDTPATDTAMPAPADEPRQQPRPSPAQAI